MGRSDTYRLLYRIITIKCKVSVDYCVKIIKSHIVMHQSDPNCTMFKSRSIRCPPTIPGGDGATWAHGEDGRR